MVKLHIRHSLLCDRARALFLEREREREKEAPRKDVLGTILRKPVKRVHVLRPPTTQPEREYDHIRHTLHQLSPAELENRGFCFVCLNEQNILWQLITDHDDIFQTHIVCKLNGADLKFLNQANSESREAMKRSKNVASVPRKFNGKRECVTV